ncbi:ELAV-like protein 2 [Schistosoma japonicum]|nr:ELAV-like protein 2 [Schistosoma japonicum]
MSSDIISTTNNDHNKGLFSSQDQFASGDKGDDNDSIHRKLVCETQTNDSTVFITKNIGEFDKNTGIVISNNTNEIPNKKFRINDVNNDKLFNHSASITHNLNNINTKNELIEENLTKTMISDTDENNGCHNKTITDTRNYSKLSDMQSPDNNSDNKSNPHSLHTSGIVDSIEHPKQSSCYYHHQQRGITFNDVSIGEDYQENNSVISTTITSSMISMKSLSLTDVKTDDKLSTSHQQSLSYNRNAGDNPSCKDVYINCNGGGTDNVNSVDCNINFSSSNNYILNQEQCNNILKKDTKSNDSRSETIVTPSAFSVNHLNTHESQKQKQSKQQFQYDHRTFTSLLTTTENSVGNIGSTRNDNNNDEYRTNIIINYLPPNMSQDEVRTLFAKCGQIESCKLIREKLTGESLGYAFVKYTHPHEANKAIHTLNGLCLQNKTIKVSLARPNCESIKGANLYICGLPKTMTQMELEELFSQCGRIITARILYDSKTGISRGIAFIRYDHRYEAELAIQQLNGYQIPLELPNDPLNKHSITVKFANSPIQISHHNFSFALLKQAAQLQSFVSSSKLPQNIPSPTVAMAATVAARLQQIATISDHLKYSLRSSNSNTKDLFSSMFNATDVVNSILTSKITASSDALTSIGWCIFVYNLAPEIKESSLWQLFGPFGAVQTIKIIYDSISHKCKGYAFVIMSNYEEALLAIHSLNGFVLDDRILQVSFKTSNNKTKSSTLNTTLLNQSISSSSDDTLSNLSNTHQTLSNKQKLLNSDEIITTKNSMINNYPSIMKNNKQQQDRFQLYQQNNDYQKLSPELNHQINSSKLVNTEKHNKPLTVQMFNTNSSVQLSINQLNEESNKQIKTTLNSKTSTELSDSFSSKLSIKPTHINSKKQTNKFKSVKNKQLCYYKQ